MDLFREKMDKSLKDLGVDRANATLGHRVAFPETMGAGKGVQEKGKGLWADEVEALAKEVTRRLSKS